MVVVIPVYIYGCEQHRPKINCHILPIELVAHVETQPYWTYKEEGLKGYETGREWNSSNSCWRSAFEGLVISQVRPTDEEEPHEMNQKEGSQLPACVQLWSGNRVGFWGQSY